MPPYHKSGQIGSIEFDQNVTAYIWGHIYISDGPMKPIERPILTAACPVSSSLLSKLLAERVSDSSPVSTSCLTLH